MKKFLNWKILLIVVILIAAFLRLYQLGNVPYGTSDDETAYIYNSYSIFHTGKDILGKTLPLSFNAHSSESPIEVYIMAPFVGLMGLSLFSGRLPAALFGIGSVFLLFLISDYLFKNKWVGIASAFLFAISPWALQVGRGVWDVDFAPFFYLLGLYIFLKNIKSYKFIWSIIPFALGFYSYHGTKVFFVFLIPVLLFLFRKELLKRKVPVLIFLSGVVLIIISFLFVIKFQDVTRQGEVYLFSDPNATKTVDWERNTSTAPFFLRGILNNKPLYFLRRMRENYLEAFSTNYLFLYGEIGLGSQIDNIYYRGELYIIELPLFLIGLYQLIKRGSSLNRNLLILMLLISPLPSTFTLDKNFVNRDYMMLPIILIITALGLYYVIKKILKLRKVYKITFILLLFLLYSFLFSEYFYQYYYRWPVYGAEAWSASSRDLVSLVANNKNKYKNVYVGNSYRNFLIQYATFEKVDPKLVQKIWNENPIKLGNITMLQTCLHDSYGKVEDFLPKSSLYISSFSDCHYVSTPSGKIVDRGEPLHTIWNIYEN